MTAPPAPPARPRCRSIRPNATDTGLSAERDADTRSWRAAGAAATGANSVSRPLDGSAGSSCSTALPIDSAERDADTGPTCTRSCRAAGAAATGANSVSRPLDGSAGSSCSTALPVDSAERDADTGPTCTRSCRAAEAAATGTNSVSRPLDGSAGSSCSTALPVDSAERDADTDPTCRPATTSETSTSTPRLPKRAKRVSGRRFVQGSNMVDNLRSRLEGRAIAGADNHVRRCFRTSLASSTRCVAQVAAGTPWASTRSSAACSLSRRSRARTIHASGLNHQTQRNTSAAICSIQSPRRTCASSCSSTTRIRSADHPDADAGSMTAGRRQPHVATSPGRGPNRRSMLRFRPHDRARSAHNRCHRPSVTRLDDARNHRSLANPTRSTPRPANAPTSQIVTATRPTTSSLATATAAGRDRLGREPAGRNATTDPTTSASTGSVNWT